MFKNEVFRTSENKVIAIPKKVIEKVGKIEFKKDKIKLLVQIGTCLKMKYLGLLKTK